VSLEDGKVDRAHCDIALGVGIRTVKGDQMGFGFTQELTAESMLAAAATAATIADGAARDSKRQFGRVKTKDYYPLQKLLTAVPLASKLPLVQGVNDKCFQPFGAGDEGQRRLSGQPERESWLSPATG
jgi:TldD protein